MAVEIFYLFLFINSIFLIFLYKKLNKYFEDIRRDKKFNRLPEIWSIFNQSKEESYINLYRQELQTLLLSDVNNTDKLSALKSSEKKYIKKVIELSGSKIIEDLSIILGGTDPIILSISNFFFTKVLEAELELTDTHFKSNSSEDDIKTMQDTLQSIFK